jgi:hypothetical protein
MDNTGRGVGSGPAPTNGPIRAQVAVEELEKKLGPPTEEPVAASEQGDSTLDETEPPD